MNLPTLTQSTHFFWQTSMDHLSAAPLNILKAVIRNRWHVISSHMETLVGDLWRLSLETSRNDLTQPIASLLKSDIALTMMQRCSQVSTSFLNWQPLQKTYKQKQSGHREKMKNAEYVLCYTSCLDKMHFSTRSKVLYTVYSMHD